MVLVPVGRLRPTQIIDVAVDMLPTASRGLRSRARVRMHIGAAEVLGRMRVLDEPAEISPGKSGLAQLRLEAPVVALHGDHFIIRTYSPPATIAGGTVVDPHAIKHRGKEILKTRERLRAMMSPDRTLKFSAFVRASGSSGLRDRDIAASTGWSDAVLSAVALAAQAKGSIVAADGVFLATEDFDSLCASLLDELAAHHKREPLARGVPRETLREKIFAHSEPEVFRAVIARLEKEGAVVSERDTVRAREHSVDLSEKDALLRDRLQEVYNESGLEAPSVEEAMVRAGVVASEWVHGRKILQLLIESHAIVRVQGEIFMHTRALDGLKAKLQQYGSEHEPERLIDVAAFKDLAGVSRKYAIPLLEYLDRERITRRAGDKRVILRI
jgi:selenocysteine-specific elongation factor